MDLESWLKDHDVKKMVMKELELYLSEHKKNEKDFNKLFKNMNLEKIHYEFHSVSYVINMRHLVDNIQDKYISARVRLDYEDDTLAEYEVIYDFNGVKKSEYFRKE